MPSARMATTAAAASGRARAERHAVLRLIRSIIDYVISISLSLKQMSAQSWLLLIYQLPARRSPARVKVWRRLQRIGAVLVKNSAWVMPESAEAREDFEWLKTEIEASGGEAMVLSAQAPHAAAQDEIVAAFRAARTEDFDTLRREASRLLERWTTRRAVRSAGRALPQVLRRLRERVRELEAIDYFESPA